MTLERLLMIVSFASMVLFLGIIVYNVPRIDLAVVVLVSLALTGWDLFFHKPS